MEWYWEYDICVLELKNDDYTHSHCSEGNDLSSTVNVVCSVYSWYSFNLPINEQDHADITKRGED